MKLKSLFLMAFMLMNTVAMSQRPAAKQQMERLKAMKVAMITQKLDLSADQAKGFWPVYDEFDAEKRKLNHDLREKLRETRGERTDQTEIKRQDEIFKLREQELALTKSYRPRFLEVISAKQYSDLLLAEKEFNQMLLKELRHRRNTRE
ncbi:Spy/CpxP family protein refolding chaperone [Jiulongibacter sp. NS-SX5]|uniref:Spy/CpxP family protein refolding chaperone n=1 Tax=Jiulongibacter sp. NS-SX5 TaxID=3463854 RepID=UPI0040587BC0